MIGFVLGFLRARWLWLLLVIGSSVLGFKVAGMFQGNAELERANALVRAMAEAQEERETQFQAFIEEANRRQARDSEIIAELNNRKPEIREQIRVVTREKIVPGSCHFTADGVRVLNQISRAANFELSGNP